MSFDQRIINDSMVVLIQFRAPSDRLVPSIFCVCGLDSFLVANFLLLIFQRPRRHFAKRGHQQRSRVGVD